MYFVTAHSNGDIGEATLAMLRSTEPFPFEAFLTPLLNELAQLQTDLILVLDDYHLITTPVIHNAVTFLLSIYPLRCIWIATRVDPPLPLAKLRVRAQLTELRADDLRFTDEEAKTFLHQSLSQPLTKVQVTTSKRKPKAGLRDYSCHALTARYRKSCGVD